MPLPVGGACYSETSGAFTSAQPEPGFRCFTSLTLCILTSLKSSGDETIELKTEAKYMKY